ncbi:hypothetical protein LTR05_004170 [Lithohypha guttulata]|uniref:Uncharacterized protein n=1 Tax=Lithohypha guttulata TaxID=1690604 RepID=A0AAN7YI60_9EURO|nr:hypothetical protein LTR05_004170 [Lithohypha guttulata]
MTVPSSSPHDVRKKWKLRDATYLSQLDLSQPPRRDATLQDTDEISKLRSSSTTGNHTSTNLQRSARSKSAGVQLPRFTKAHTCKKKNKESKAIQAAQQSVSTCKAQIAWREGLMRTSNHIPVNLVNIDIDLASEAIPELSHCSALLQLGFLGFDQQLHIAYLSLPYAVLTDMHELDKFALAVCGRKLRSLGILDDCRIYGYEVLYHNGFTWAKGRVRPGAPTLIRSNQAMLEWARQNLDTKTHWAKSITIRLVKKDGTPFSPSYRTEEERTLVGNVTAPPTTIVKTRHKSLSEIEAGAYSRAIFTILFHTKDPAATKRKREARIQLVQAQKQQRIVDEVAEAFANINFGHPSLDPIPKSSVGGPPASSERRTISAPAISFPSSTAVIDVDMD